MLFKTNTNQNEMPCGGIRFAHQTADCASVSKSNLGRRPILVPSPSSRSSFFGERVNNEPLSVIVYVVSPPPLLECNYTDDRRIVVCHQLELCADMSPIRKQILFIRISKFKHLERLASSSINLQYLFYSPTYMCT